MKCFKSVLISFLSVLFLVSCGSVNSELPITEELEQISMSTYGGIAGGGYEYTLERKSEGVLLTETVIEGWQDNQTKKVYRCPEDALMRVQEFMIKEGIWKIKKIKSDEQIIPDLRGITWSSRISGKEYIMFSGQLMGEKYGEKFRKLEEMIERYKLSEKELE